MHCAVMMPTCAFHSKHLPFKRSVKSCEQRQCTLAMKQSYVSRRTWFTPTDNNRVALAWQKVTNNLPSQNAVVGVPPGPFSSNGFFSQRTSTDAWRKQGRPWSAGSSVGEVQLKTKQQDRKKQMCFNKHNVASVWNLIRLSPCLVCVCLCVELVCVCVCIPLVPWR